MKTNLQGYKILLAEDVDVNRLMIVQFLEEWWKIKPEMAKNGKEAVEKATVYDYDIILMDLKMPVMDGFEAAAHIRQLPGRESIPIIAFTANTRAEFNKNRHAELFNDIITKPVEPEDLQKLLIKYFKSRNNTSPCISFDNMINYIGDDPVKIKKLLIKTLESLQIYAEEFKIAVSENNATKLSDVKHKAKMMINMLQLDDLQQLFNDAKKQVGKENPVKEKLNMQAEEIFKGLRNQITNYLDNL